MCPGANFALFISFLLYQPTALESAKWAVMAPRGPPKKRRGDLFFERPPLSSTDPQTTEERREKGGTMVEKV